MSKPKSIALNSIWYLMYQVFNVLFPFILTLYGARVLLPVGVGRVISAQNIASYFALFAFLGIPTYGRREISKARNDKLALSRIYSELFIINTISTLCFCIVYLGLVFIVPEFRAALPLYLITGGAIALTFFNNSWLFEGVEDFRFISLRNITFKAASLVLLFILVRDESDYLMFALIMVMGTAGNYILNVFFTPRVVKFTLQGLDFRRHLTPIFALVAVNIAIELYSLVDVTMLRFLKGETSAAFYFYAQGINKVLQQVINSFTIVIVPRLALYYKEKKSAEFNSLVSKSLNTIIVLALPMIVGVEVVAGNAIYALYGPEYTTSVPVLRTLIVLLIVSPVGYLLGSRILLVTGHEFKMTLCVWIGAVVNVVCNFVLIPRLGEIGAAAASVISEVCVAVIYIIMGRHFYKLTYKMSSVVKVVVGSLLMGLAAFGAGLLFDNVILKLIVQVVSGVVVYFVVLLVTKEEMVVEYWGKVRKKLGFKSE